jgi:hypothetical protein
LLVGPLVEDVSELAAAVGRFLCSDLSESCDGVRELLRGDGFAGGRLVPGVEGVDPGFGCGEMLGEVLPFGVHVVASQRVTGRLDPIAGDGPFRVRFNSTPWDRARDTNSRAKPAMSKAASSPSLSAPERTTGTLDDSPLEPLDLFIAMILSRRSPSGRGRQITPLTQNF